MLVGCLLSQSFAGSPFSGPWSPRFRVDQDPASSEARERAKDELLGIKHYSFALGAEPSSQSYEIRVEPVSEEKGQEVKNSLVMRSSNEPSVLGISVLLGAGTSRMKLYAKGVNVLCDLPFREGARIEHGDLDAGVLLRCIVGKEEIFRVTWTKKAEQVGAGQTTTRPESKPEGGDKPQPEAEGHSR